MRAWGFASIRLPPHGMIGATYPIIKEVRFIPVNPSPLLKVALPLGSSLPPSPALVIVKAALPLESALPPIHTIMSVHP